MTREDILSMARKAGFSVFKDEEVWGCCDSFITEELKRFAVLVAAAEREACAKVCEAGKHSEYDGHADCAAAIRARGQA